MTQTYGEEAIEEIRRIAARAEIDIAVNDGGDFIRQDEYDEEVAHGEGLERVIEHMTKELNELRKKYQHVCKSHVKTLADASYWKRVARGGENYIPEAFADANKAVSDFAETLDALPDDIKEELWEASEG